jgi:hypothetical protein
MLAVQVIFSGSDAEAPPIQNLVDRSLIRELESEGLFEQLYG